MATPSSRGSFWSRDWTWVSYVSCIGRWALYHWCHLGSPSVIMDGRHVQIPPTHSQWGQGGRAALALLGLPTASFSNKGDSCCQVATMVTQLDKIHSENLLSMSQHISLPVSISCRPHFITWPQMASYWRTQSRRHWMCTLSSWRGLNLLRTKWGNCCEPNTFTQHLLAGNLVILQQKPMSMSLGECTKMHISRSRPREFGNTGETLL